MKKDTEIWLAYAAENILVIAQSVHRVVREQLAFKPPS